MIQRWPFGRRGTRKKLLDGEYFEPLPFPGAVHLDRVKHARLYWSAPLDCEFARSCAALPVVLSEVLSVAAFLPLVLAPGRLPRPMVVLSQGRDFSSPLLPDGCNLLAILRFYPFLSTRDSRSGKILLAGDLAGPCLGADESFNTWQPVFAADGALAPEAAKRVANLSGWLKERDTTLAAAHELHRADLLRLVSIAGKDWQSVDPSRLTGLTAETLFRLNQSGALALAYALITGAMHLHTLSRGNPVLRVQDKEEIQEFIAALQTAEENDGLSLSWPELARA